MKFDSESFLITSELTNGARTILITAPDFVHARANFGSKSNLMRPDVQSFERNEKLCFAA
jgi:hypothetical protein